MDMSDYANIAFPMGICLTGLILFLAFTGLSCKIHSSAVIEKKYINKSFFFFYIAGIILFLLVPSNFWLRIWYNMMGRESAEIDVSEFFSGSFNVVPRLFRYVFGESTYGGWTHRMLLSNIILFIPFGMLVPSILKKISYRKVIFTSVMFSSAIELLQPVVGRSFDIDDIIMRTIGTTFGFLFYLICESKVKRVLKNSTKEQRMKMCSKQNS